MAATQHTIAIDDKGEDVELKTEDERRDAMAVEALEQRRSAALHIPEVPQGGELKRKRAHIEEEREAKRRRQQPGAVLLDTGRIRTMITSTTLVNLRPFMFLSSSMPYSTGPAMGVRRGACAVALVDSTRLLVMGGNEGTNSYGTTEVLDLREFRHMQFSRGPRLASQRRECAAISLDANRVLVVGGYDGSHFLNTTEILDVKTSQFVSGPRMNVRRAAPAIAMLKSGYVVVIGGKNANGCLETTEILDPNSLSMSFIYGPSMRMQRAGPVAAVMDGGRLMVLGGHDNNRTHNTTEVLYMVDSASRPPAMVFTPGPPLTTPRSYFAGVMLNAGNLYIIGGHDGYNYLNSTDVLNLASMEYTTGPALKRRRFMCSAALVAEGRVLVLGGSDVAVDHSSTEMLTLAMYSFMPADWMNAR